MFSCTLALGRLATAPARSGPRAGRAGGATPGPALAPGRFAKAGQARLAYGRSPRLVDVPGFELAVTEPDACARKFLQNQFSFLWKMCDL